MCKKKQLLFSLSALVLVTAFVLIMVFSYNRKGNALSQFYGNTPCEVSISISRDAYPKGANSAVIVSDDIFSEAYWCAPALAGFLDAPILISSDEEQIKKELRRLKPSNVYILGETDFRYDKSKCIVFDEEAASLQIADYINEHFPSQLTNVFFVSNTDEAAAVSAQSGKYSIPIIFISKEAVPPEAKRFLTYSPYLVGSKYSAEVTNMLEGTYQNIPGSDICELAGYAQLIFDSGADTVVTVKNPCDITYASVISRVRNTSFLYCNQSFSRYQEAFLANNPIEKYIYVISGASDCNSLIAETESIAENIDKYNLEFNNTKFKGAVFYIPHQDDETIFFSQAIISAIDAFGPENVHAVLFSDGSKSGTQNLSYVAEGLDSIMGRINASLSAPLDNDTYTDVRTKLFSCARNNEFLGAMASMGIPDENIALYEFPDGGFSDIIVEISDIMRSYYENDSLMHFTFSPYYESHADHRSLGTALLNVCGVSAENVFFIIRYDNSINLFVGEQEKYSSHRKMIYTQPTHAKLKAAVQEYDKYECQSELIAAEISTAIINGEKPVTVVQNAASVNDLRLAVGYCSMKRVCEDLLNRLDTGTIVTTMHRPFINENINKEMLN